MGQEECHLENYYSHGTHQGTVSYCLIVVNGCLMLHWLSDRSSAQLQEAVSVRVFQSVLFCMLE